MRDRSRVLQWARATWGMAALFGSLPVASRIFLGSWGFPEAAELSFVCLTVGTYLEIRGRRRLKALRDDATALERALSLAAEGRTREAEAVLTKAVRISPKLWQAYQYRGQLRMHQPDFWSEALADFNEAIRLAPKEPHLYTLRSQVYDLLGDDSSARKDQETAVSLRET